MTADIITSDTADRVYQSALSKSNPKSPNPARIYSKLMRIQSEATYFGAVAMRRNTVLLQLCQHYRRDFATKCQGLSYRQALCKYYTINPAKALKGTSELITKQCHGATHVHFIHI